MTGDNLQKMSIQSLKLALQSPVKLQRKMWEKSSKTCISQQEIENWEEKTYWDTMACTFVTNLSIRALLVWSKFN